MNSPRFLLADNTDYPDDVFVIHLDYPKFMLNMSRDDEFELLEEIDHFSEEDEKEMINQLEELMEKAVLFFERETDRYEDQNYSN